MNYSSDFLFAHPSFWREIGRLFDLGGLLTEFNTSLTTDQADFFAMRADWLSVGDELRSAMQAMEIELDSKGLLVT